MMDDQSKSRAVIDIGSNTILLVAGRLNPQGQLETSLNLHEVARLSENLRDGGALDSKAKERVLDILKSFRDQVQAKGIKKILAGGTAAFRRAVDGKAFAKTIEDKLGIAVRILSGREEANLSYQSARMDFSQNSGEIGMIDTGGGSTELVFAKDSWVSLPMGTIRLVEEFVKGHPIPDDIWKSIQANTQNILKTQLQLPSRLPETWVAVAATPTALATLIQALPSYQEDKVHGYKMKVSDLATTVEKLRTSGMEERLAMKGMLPKRAELLPLGGIILLRIMEFLNLKEITVSDHGWRYGLLQEILSQDAN